jgi:hypothetical protein
LPYAENPATPIELGGKAACFQSAVGAQPIENPYRLKRQGSDLNVVSDEGMRLQVLVSVIWTGKKSGGGSADNRHFAQFLGCGTSNELGHF